MQLSTKIRQILDWSCKWYRRREKKLLFSTSKVFLKLLFRILVAISSSTKPNSPNFGSIFLLHGGMGTKEKLWTINAFRICQGPAMLLISKGVGAESLTLIEASNVYFDAPHWNRKYRSLCICASFLHVF